MKIKNIVLAGIVISASFYGISQKKNVTSAAVEFNRTRLPLGFMNPEFNTEAAIKSVKTAQKFIDLASEHEDTKNGQKQLWYQGQIYSAIATLAGMDTTAFEISSEDALKKSLAAFTQGGSKKGKYSSDIKSSTEAWSSMFIMGAGMAYEQKMYKEAGEAYFYGAKYIISGGEYDSTNLYNAAVCYDLAKDYSSSSVIYAELATYNYKGTTSAILASAAYRKLGESEKALAIIDEARKTNPTNKDLLLELVNTNIDTGNAAGAQKALSDAIATDPNNKQLHYTIGTIYIDLKENAKAEESLNKALEIDPDYADAQYQLGAHLVSWAGDVKYNADQLPFNDPNYNVMIQESNDLYARALVPLEKYIANYPEDQPILNILFQIHRNLGNTEKALDYKKRSDALK